MRSMIPCLIFLFAVALADSEQSLADTWNVPGDSPTIQGAVDMASPGDVIEIACGTYSDCTHPDMLGWLNCVIMTPGLTLRGMGPDPSCVTIDASGGRGILCWNLSGQVTIENLTIRNGSIVMNRSSSGNALVDADGGAGISIDNADVSIRNCRFENNLADYGGAILADNGTVTISYSVFDGNTAFDYGGGVYGVGITLENCYFLNNNSFFVGGGCYGINVSAESCLFESNTAEYGGGGLSGEGLELFNCSVRSNSASIYGGGGLLLFGDLFAFNTDFLGNTAPAGMGESGFVETGAHALLSCCDTDISTWLGPGTRSLDNSDCVVAQEELSWGSVKALYR